MRKVLADWIEEPCNSSLEQFGLCEQKPFVARNISGVSRLSYRATRFILHKLLLLC